MKARLSDPDVVAIVTNDLSRLHRKGWRVGSLIDFIEQHNVSLILAAPGRNLDLSGAGGKITTMIMALMDEYYATDISQKQKDSVQYRRANGIVVGRIPFGTIRDQKSRLTRSNLGVWLLPDGTTVEAEEGKPIPEEGAIWRGYADAVERCFEIYIEGWYGRRAIAEMLNREGFRFRKLDGSIALFGSDDVRCITANWVEYAGGMIYGKADHRRSKGIKPEDILVDPERAVFDVEMCLTVGKLRYERARDHKGTLGNGIHIDAKAYPLSKLVYCGHCEQLAIERNDVRERTYLTGFTGSQVTVRRYRHDTERRCPAHARSVKAELIEDDFVRLLKNITINPEAMPLIMEALNSFNGKQDGSDRQQVIQAEIVHWRQRSKNADVVFYQARISEDEWHKLVEEADHEIARLQAQLMQGKEVETAILVNLDMISDLSTNWAQSSDDTRRAMASSLFEYLVYGLDERRIVDFRLKP